MNHEPSIMDALKIKKSKRSGADRRWTLLFISDHGNVITLKHFKAILIGAGSLFFLAIGFVAVLSFLNKGTLKENKDLHKRFAESEKQIEKLRHEKEILMARLVLAETKTKETAAGERQAQDKVKIVEPAAPLPQASPKEEVAKADQTKPPVLQAASPEPAPAETDEAEPIISVAVENFEVSRERGAPNLNAQFKIKNTSPEQQRVIGHAVVILKGEDLDRDQWLVMPQVDLDGDKPTGKRGRSFSILRFRTMIFTSKAPENSDQFQTAAVYVYTKTGELLLEQDFSIELPPAPARSAEPPAARTSTREKAPSETPAGETPSSDVPVDSTTSPPPVF